MKFLNKKEQVIDLQLTQYGKRLLSKGKFKPSFYAFFDDGVLYDSQWGDVSEVQNDSQNRIIKDTPRLEAQYNFSGVETNIKRENDYIRSQPEEDDYAIQDGVFTKIDQGRFFQSFKDKNYLLTSMLGTSELSSDKLPAWKISLISGEITGSTAVSNYLTCSNPMINVPQLEISPITYESKVEVVPDWQLSDYNPEDLYGNQIIKILSRNSELLIEINEKNTTFENENFDIEIYEVSTEIDSNVSLCNDQQVIERLVPLYFIKPFEDVQNGILMDQQEDVFQNPNLDLDPSYVEYYMDVLVDNEIPEQIICRYTLNEGEGIFSQRVLNCEQYKLLNQTGSGESLFDTDIDFSNSGIPGGGGY
jgi:hypothetical protein